MSSTMHVLATCAIVGCHVACSVSDTQHDNGGQQAQVAHVPDKTILYGRWKHTMLCKKKSKLTNLKIN